MLADMLCQLRNDGRSYSAASACESDRRATAGFADTLKNIGLIGMTFGRGCFSAHGDRRANRLFRRRGPEAGPAPRCEAPWRSFC